MIFEEYQNYIIFSLTFLITTYIIRQITIYNGKKKLCKNCKLGKFNNDIKKWICFRIVEKSLADGSDIHLNNLCLEERKKGECGIVAKYYKERNK